MGPGPTTSRRGANGGGATTCIALLGIAIGHVVCPEPNIRPETDPITLKAFVALSKLIQAPVGDTTNRPEIKAVGGFYFLWAMERIAVLYDVRKLGKKDWYQWGAEILLCHQRGNGSWDSDGGYPGQTPVLNTCFALLFLRRANLTPDLSKQLVLDTTALTAKVDETIAPKPAPPPPSPKVEAPPEIAIAPPPHIAKPKLPPSPPPQPTPPPEPAEDPPPPPAKTPWLLIVIGVIFGGGAGGGLAFLVVRRMRKDQEEDEEKPRKKKGKKKAKVAAEKLANRQRED